MRIFFSIPACERSFGKGQFLPFTGHRKGYKFHWKVSLSTEEYNFLVNYRCLSINDRLRTDMNSISDWSWENIFIQKYGNGISERAKRKLGSLGTWLKVIFFAVTFPFKFIRISKLTYHIQSKYLMEAYSVCKSKQGKIYHCHHFTEKIFTLFSFDQIPK